VHGAPVLAPSSAGARSSTATTALSFGREKPAPPGDHPFPSVTSKGSKNNQGRKRRPPELHEGRHKKDVWVVREERDKPDGGEDLGRRRGERAGLRGWRAGFTRGGRTLKRERNETPRSPIRSGDRGRGREDGASEPEARPDPEKEAGGRGGPGQAQGTGGGRRARGPAAAAEVAQGSKAGKGVATTI